MCVFRTRIIHKTHFKKYIQFIKTTSSLPGLNADFDGDILNIIGIVSEEMKYAFRKFDPVSRMIISRDNGLLNEYFSLSKGHLIDLYYFLTVD